MTRASRRYDGPMGKSDRAFVFGALALWCGLGWGIAPRANCAFPLLMALLVAATVINRVRNGLVDRNQGGCMVDVTTTRVVEERFFTAADGSHLFYRYWPDLPGRAPQ